jgi:fumarylacetoacetase
VNGFPIENLPFGVFSIADSAPRVGVAIDDDIVDLTSIDLDVPGGTFAASSLNPLIALGEPAWRSVRQGIVEAIDAGDGVRHRRTEAVMHLPIAVGDYVDFYSSIHHATNVGRLFRPSEPLLPNWRHLPVGYHGRSGTIVVSGTDVRRPQGQRRGNPSPACGPSIALDFELEVGFVTGNANRPGEPVPIDEAERHIFGICLVNDWSARDLQAWEYQPLGPFLAKSFATSISPWIVPLPAVAAARVDQPRQDPPVLPYLRTDGATALDLRLEVELVPAGSEAGTVITRTSFADMYWTMAQQLAHATVNGATARAGDLFASGTVSGPSPGTLGCLLEITKNGTEPITLEDGSVRTYLEDGDTVVMRGWCGEDPIISLGECVGTVLP